MRALPRGVAIAALPAFLLVLVLAIAPRTGASAEGKIIVCLDPGHSLITGGASVEVKEGRGRNATTRTLTEPEINVDVARAVAADLRARFDANAVSVILTWGELDSLEDSRDWSWSDGPAADGRPAVEARGAFCEDNGARIVVSLHTNGINVPFNGTLTGYQGEDDLALAGPAHTMIYNELQHDHRGKKIRAFRNFGLDQGDWWLALGAPSSVVALFEPVVMTNEAEAQRLLDPIGEAPNGRRAQIAAIEAEAIAVYVAGVLAAP